MMRKDLRNRVSSVLPAWLGSILALFSLACGGGGGGGAGSSDGPGSAALGGSGVKGPLAGAVVTVYQVDPAAADLKGAVLDTGETNASAAILDVEIPGDMSGQLLVEFTVDADTIDITTGVAPIFDTLVTIVDASRVLAGESIYATPLSTLAVTLAAENAGDAGVFGGDGDGTLSAGELANALDVAASQVASTFGFGLLDGMDVFSAAPLLGPEMDTPEKLAEVAAFRTANEALAAVTHSIGEDADPAVDPADVLAALATDLGDGIVDGMADGAPVADLAAAPNFATLVMDDPSNLMIPGTTIPVNDSDELLASELAVTGVEVDAGDLADGTIASDPDPAEPVPDTDGDTVRDDVDNCVTEDNTAQDDFDVDTLGDVCDPDDDNDGALDGDDAFPMDATETTDTDGDGTGNNADPDDDGDGALDGDDDFPLDDSETTDTDEDGTGDNADTDDDNDGVLDGDDAFPLDPEETTDTDGDGTGDNADLDDDGDQVADADDNCPSVPNPGQEDVDGDDIGDACDDDVPPPAQGLVWDDGNWDAKDWQ